MTDRVEEIKNYLTKDCDPGWMNALALSDLQWLITEVERLRASHDTMTVDCQIQGCREKLNHELIDKLEAEIEQLQEANKALITRGARFAEDCINKDATIERLRNKPQKCNSGHERWPITLWDCPDCVVTRLVEKDATIATLTEAIQCMWQIIPDPKDDRLWTQELATELADIARKALAATKGNKAPPWVKCADKRCFCQDDDKFVATEAS